MDYQSANVPGKQQLKNADNPAHGRKAGLTGGGLSLQIQPEFLDLPGQSIASPAQ